GFERMARLTYPKGAQSMKRMLRTSVAWIAALLAAGVLTASAAETKKDKKPEAAQATKEKEKEETSILPAPPRAEGEGPFKRLILHGVTLIDGTGAPPVGPVDIVIEKNRIADVEVVGSPGVEIDPKHRPKAKDG